MNTYRKIITTFLFAGVLLIAGAAVAQDGPTPDFAIDWYTLDGGGGLSTGATFSLTGTIGQHDASVMESTGGVYSLSGGFWGAGASSHLFSDGFEN
jgi:hypothetical protein